MGNVKTSLFGMARKIFVTYEKMQEPREISWLLEVSRRRERVVLIKDASVKVKSSYFTGQE